MDIHFWDMDGTLLNGDVDNSWKSYLINLGLAPPEAKEQTDAFYEQYCQGNMDQIAFARFQYAEFVDLGYARVSALAQEHFDTHIREMFFPQATSWIQIQQSRGIHQVLLTATCQELAEPVAKHLGITEVIATGLERMGDRYTGELDGTYCGGVGKISYIREYLAKIKAPVGQTYYYGDSVTDIPVFHAVDRPIICNPNDALYKVAIDNRWPIYDFRASLATS